MPALRLEALLARLGQDGTGASPGWPDLVWLHGDESLLQLEAADALRTRARSDGFVEREVIPVDRSLKAEHLLAAANGLSLFAERRFLELRFGATRPNRELGETIARIGEALAERADGQLRLLVTSPRLERATQESAWWQRVERAALCVAIFPIERNKLGAWIGGRLARQGQRADEDLLALMAQRVEGNLLAAHQEIRKLALLCPPGALDPTMVERALADVARFDAFDAVDAMLAGDASRALRALEGLRAEAAAVPLVLWALADACRTLARLASDRAQGRPLTTSMRQLRVFGARERLFELALRRGNAGAVAETALAECANADRIAKGLESGDPWQSLIRVALLIAGAPVFTECL